MNSRKTLHEKIPANAMHVVACIGLGSELNAETISKVVAAAISSPLFGGLRSRYDFEPAKLATTIEHLTPEERSIVANLARYHRKSTPDPAHPNFRDLDKDARSRVRGLAAILRIADALDREHLAKISGVRAAIDASRRRITLTLSGDDERELEEWTVHAKADLLRDVYGLEVTVAGEKLESTSARPTR